MMIQILALFTGILLSVMVSVNGSLSAQIGSLWAAVVIHAVGSVFASAACAAEKEKRPLWGQGPVWIYLGGAVGVATTIFNNLACEYISITSIMALGLLGQILTSLCIDTLGLFGMKKVPFMKYRLWGFGFSLLGVAFMLDLSILSSAAAILMSVGAGITVVLSRTINARLAGKIGALRGSCVNHLVGLPITVLIAVAFSGVPAPGSFAVDTGRLWIYLGGVMGVMTVLLFNLTVPRLPAFQVTVITFVGQIFTGVVIDLAAGAALDRSFWGGLTVALGIGVNLVLDRQQNKEGT